MTFAVLSPEKLTVGNETKYKFDDMLSLNNETKLYTSVYGMKLNLDINNEIKSLYTIETQEVAAHGVSSKVGVEYKPTEEVKLTANVLGNYEYKKSTIDKGGVQRKYEAKVDAKAEFESKEVKGLKSDLKLNYGFKNVNTNVEKDNLTAKTKVHAFELDSNVSYVVDLTNGFELTPAFNLKYKTEFISLADKLVAEEGTATLKTNALTLKPSTKLTYKYDKLTAGLKLETPFEFNGTKLEVDKYNKVKPGAQAIKKDFEFKKGTIKGTLSLEYKW